MHLFLHLLVSLFLSSFISFLHFYLLHCFPLSSFTVFFLFSFLSSFSLYVFLSLFLHPFPLLPSIVLSSSLILHCFTLFSFLPFPFFYLSILVSFWHFHTPFICPSLHLFPFLYVANTREETHKENEDSVKSISKHLNSKCEREGTEKRRKIESAPQKSLTHAHASLISLSYSLNTYSCEGKVDRYTNISLLGNLKAVVVA